MITRRGTIASGVVSGASWLAHRGASAGEIGLYLPTLEAAEKAFRDNENRQVERLAGLRAAVGDEAGALAVWAERRSGPWPPLAVDVSGSTAEAALPAIISAAKGKRVVMINEAHHVSRCRAFAATVARGLRSEGFDILAAEAFISEPGMRFDERMAAGEAVTFNTGGYTRDPVFAELMRQARADGYRLKAYERRGDQAARAGESPFDAREAAQAANLEAILDQNPNACILIVCGFGHLAEAPVSLGIPMAAKLKARTGIDPLTIDQSFGIPAPQAEQEPPLVTALLGHFKPREPIVVRRADGSGWGGSLEAKVDMTVFHPRLADTDGRPGWLAVALDRRRMVFALPKDVPAGGLIQAVPMAEAAAPAVVPADQYRLPANASEAVFFLRPGAYEVRMETRGGRRVLGKL